MANQALRAVGANPPAGDAGVGTTTSAAIADEALRSLGVNPAIAPFLANAPVSIADVAKQALRILSVNPNPGGPNMALGTTTIALLAPQVLQRLGVIDAQEAGSEADINSVAETLLRLHQIATEAGIANWSENAIPRWAALQYEIMAAALSGPIFRTGTPIDQQSYAAAFGMLRELAATGGNGQALAEVKVRQANSNLQARGIANWDGMAAVPGEMADALAAIAANSLAPLYGKQSDAGLAEAMAQSIREVMLTGVRGQAIAVAKALQAHAMAVGRGAAGWPSDVIPRDMAPFMVEITAALLGPVYGKEGGLAAAEAAIAGMRATLLSGQRGQAVALEKAREAQSLAIGRGVATWPADAVPAEMVAPMVDLTASLLAPAYGKQAAPVDAILVTMRALTLAGPLGQEMALEKLRAVHADLSARGRTRWLSTDIPEEAAEPYADLAAVRLGPEVGAQVDGAAVLGAEIALARITSLGPSTQVIRKEYF